MTTIRLLLASAFMLVAAMTTVVTVAPQPARAIGMACSEIPQPVRA